MKRNGSRKIRVGIIGVGNCASSLVQGVQFYRNARQGEFVPGLMHADLGGYHVRDIELVYDEAAPNTLLARFLVNSKQDRDVLVWTSSLFFQYIHYHVARIATVNGAPHHMDWEAQQDPHGPERVKRWVEYGKSLIERLHKRET